MARLLAENLGRKHHVTYSIAGATQTAILPQYCNQISGGFGFGGASGLIDYIRTQNIEFCIDATHPFAQNISQNSIDACAQTHTPIIQYARKVWHVDGAQEFQTAVELISNLPDEAQILLTIGGQNIAQFLALKQNTIARMIEAPKLEGKSLPDNFKILLSRPPYKLDDEIKLMQKHNISHLICKDSGGEKLADKLIAAQQLGIQILMLARPTSPHKIKIFTIDEIENHLNKRLLVSPS